MALRSLLVCKCVDSTVCIVLSVVAGMLIVSNKVQAQAWKADVGLDALILEKGASLEDGSGVSVLQPEAPDGGDDYMPDPGNSQFSGKSFTNGTIPADAGVNSHATSVGIRLYGNTSGMAPGVTDITGANGNDFFTRYLGFEDTGSSIISVGDPIAQGYDVSNHSYIITGIDPSSAKGVFLERYDFVIERDNTVAVAGLSNGGNSIPDLWAHSYNGITVGVSDGTHSRGQTTFYGPGRYKPDIVAPESTTSNATPLVSGAAAILRQAGNVSGAVDDGEQNEVIKALLFAGATKNESEFSLGWDRTTTRPIDDVYGFGELNILNSYHILEGGQKNAAAGTVGDMTAGTVIGQNGWDYGDFDGAMNRTLSYDFEVASGTILDELSAALVWNLQVVDTAPPPNSFVASTTLANLDLQLFEVSGTPVLIDSSLSTNYNLEHIYLNDLEAGNYRFQITGDLTATDFGFAWRSSVAAIPEPSSVLCLGLLSLSCLANRRRRV